VAAIEILAVCGHGVGSGVLAKMTIERALKKAGVAEQEYHLEIADIGTAKRPNVDIFVTNHEFANSISQWKKDRQRLVVVKNLFSDKEMEKALTPVFQELTASKG
jgi:PTS system ascorbate-specific IIB component